MIVKKYIENFALNIWVELVFFFRVRMYMPVVFTNKYSTTAVKRVRQAWNTKYATSNTEY